MKITKDTDRECRKCFETKDLKLFSKDKRLDKGVTYTCLNCSSKYKHQHYLENKAKYIFKAKIWKSQNKELVKTSNKKSSIKYRKENILRSRIWQQKNSERVLAKTKKWQIENKEKVKIQRSIRNKYRLKNDPIFVYKKRIRSMIHTSFLRGGYSKNGKCENILGCDFDFFKSYIESQFKNGMNWDNIHLDHIRPLSAANSKEDVLELNHYTNFQPLLALDNLKKSSKLIDKQLRLL